MTPQEANSAQTAEICAHRIEHDRWQTDPADRDYLEPADCWCRVCGKLDSDHPAATIPGAMSDSEHARLDDLPDGGRAAKLYRAQHPFLLGIYRRDNDGNGEIADPAEVEPGHPSYFAAPRFAKAAGAAILERNPETLGYDVAKIHNGGHYKTVASVWRDDVDSTRKG